jgi:hypothetical protein
MYHVTLTLLPHKLTEDKHAYLFYHITLIELLGHSKVLKVFVVSPDLNAVLSALEIVSPLFKSSDDGEHLGVMDVIHPSSFNILAGWNVY